MSRRPPRFFLPVVPLLLTLFLPLIGFLIWFSAQSQPINPQADTQINLSISRGSSLDAIGEKLLDARLIRSLAAFKIQVFLSGLSDKLQAGDFMLSQRQNLKSIVNALTLATFDRRVTLIEGWRREQIAQAIVDAFSRDNKDYSFDAEQFRALSAPLEGQLFPDTYSFPKDVTAQEVIDILTARFRDQTVTLLNQSGLTDAEALVLASLVEREALTDAERPIVAGILLKRLNQGWPLQVDATLQYAKATATCRLLTCDWWPKNITKADLAKPSPFNTYLNPGLPPSPIANPSLASLKAAYDPSPTAFYFYLHDPSGNIRYAKTIEEHNANVSRYLNK